MKEATLFEMRPFFILLVSFLLLPAWAGAEPSMPYRLGERTYDLLIADTPEKWERGLMFRKSLEKDGMIFLFPQKQQRTFWNMNTFLDLDIYWLDGDRVVGKDFLPSFQKAGTIVNVTSPAPVDGVVEIVVRGSAPERKIR